MSFGDDKGGDNEKPFDDEPFDAGVEADEDEDPEKFIQQLAGKLGTSLRKYNDERGEPDFDLEKYTINSVISATHTSEMDEKDQKDIIKKVRMSGADDGKDDDDAEGDDFDLEDEKEEDFGEEEKNKGGEDKEEDLGEEYNEVKENELLGINQTSIDSIDSSSIIYVWDRAIGGVQPSIKRMRYDIGKLMNREGISFEEMKREVESSSEDETLYEDSWSNPMEISEGVEVSGDLQYHLDNKISLGEGLFRYGSDSYVKLYTEVKILKDLNAIKLNENDEELIKDFTNQSVIIEGERILLNLIVEDNGSSILEEGDKKSKDKYKGKKSNSPTRGASGGKAYKVFVPGCNAKTKSNPRGIKKIQFGSGGLKAKLSNKEAKKSYNARHGCAKGKHNDKCKAGYWSCRLPRYAKSLGLSGGGTWW